MKKNHPFITITFTIFSALMFSPFANAHDFWLEPQSFHLDGKSKTLMGIHIGHPDDHQRWAIDLHRIVAFKSFGPEGVEDQQKRLSIRSSNGDIPISLNQAGTHLFTIETTSAYSVLPSDKFNAYVEEEGIVPIDALRKRTASLETDGREIYSRRGKSLIQMGPITEEGSKHITKPVGMTLEITPLKNPYAVSPNAPLKAQITYRGRPTKDITVGLIRLDNGEGLVKKLISNENGIVTYNRPAEGNWMLHAVWSDPLEGNPDAEFDTIFSSLSFGFE